MQAEFTPRQTSIMNILSLDEGYFYCQAMFFKEMAELCGKYYRKETAEKWLRDIQARNHVYPVYKKDIGKDLLTTSERIPFHIKDEEFRLFEVQIRKQRYRDEHTVEFKILIPVMLGLIIFSLYMEIGSMYIVGEVMLLLVISIMYYYVTPQEFETPKKIGKFISKPIDN